MRPQYRRPWTIARFRPVMRPKAGTEGTDTPEWSLKVAIGIKTRRRPAVGRFGGVGRPAPNTGPRAWSHLAQAFLICQSGCHVTVEHRGRHKPHTRGRWQSRRWD